MIGTVHDLDRIAAAARAAVQALEWDVVREYRGVTVYQSPAGACIRLTDRKAHIYAYPNRHPGWPVAQLPLTPVTGLIAYATTYHDALTDDDNQTQENTP